MNTILQIHKADWAVVLSPWWPQTAGWEEIIYSALS